MLDFYRVDQVLGTPETIWGFLGKWVSVGTFVLGIAADRWYLRYDKRRKDKKIVQDLLTEIELLEEPMRKQLEEIEGFVEKLRSDKDDVIIFSTYLSLNVDRLKTVDRSSLADHLEKPFKDRTAAMSAANNILIGCEAITGKYKEVRSTVHHHAETSANIRKHWEEEVENFNLLFLTLMSEANRHGISVRNDLLLDSIEKLTNPRSRIHRTDIYDIDEHCFKPLDELFPRFITDPRTTQLMDANRKIRRCVKKLMHEQKSTAKRLEVIAKYMRDEFEEMQVIVSSIPSAK